MKRLVLCFDGTWSALADPTALTNVVKLANLVNTSHDHVPQITYYNSGVGTGGPIDQLLGGLFGVGLKSNVKRGLTFLALNWEAGDEIYLFGFSRGAYTARALAGVIAAVGIPIDITHAERHWDCYQRIAKLRPRPGASQEEQDKAQAEIDRVRAELVGLSRNTDESREWLDVPIKCVGVWDTVGSYGVPSGLGLRALPYLFTQWTRGFRDTHFGRTVEVGLHAVAIDERRRPFAPTFWTFRPKSPGEVYDEEQRTVEQVWFAGVHANIGGGYINCGLSDLSLAWMLAQVQDRTGLRFNEIAARDTVWPCSACTLYTSTRWTWLNPARTVFPDFAAGLRAFLNGMMKRPPRIRINEKIHWSVRERLGWERALVDRGEAGRYAPPNLKKDLTAVTEPLPLELDLLKPDSKRDAKNPCPMKTAGLPCQCEKRGLLSGDTSPSTRETPPPIAA